MRCTLNCSTTTGMSKSGPVDLGSMSPLAPVICYIGFEAPRRIIMFISQIKSLVACGVPAAALSRSCSHCELWRSTLSTDGNHLTDPNIQKMLQAPI